MLWDSMYLLFAVWRPRLLRLVRGFRFFIRENSRSCIVYFFKVQLRHLAHSSMKSFDAHSPHLSEIHCSLYISDGIMNPQRMLFFTGSQRYSEKHILTELFEYQYWSLKVLMLSILFVSDILTDRAPPDIALTKHWLRMRYIMKHDVIQISLQCMPIFIIFHSRCLWDLSA